MKHLKLYEHFNEKTNEKNFFDIFKRKRKLVEPFYDDVDDPWGEETPIVRTFWDWFEENYAYLDLKKTTTINCYDQRLTSLKGIENLRNLRVLDCSYNPGLTSLKGIENLRNLQSLSCHNNPGLTSLEGIENLGNLHVLSCSNNPGLTGLDEIKNLRNLQRLSCYNNTGFSTEYIDYLKKYCSERKIKLDI